MLSEEQEDPAQASLADLESYSNSWALQEGKVTHGYSQRRPFSPAVRKGRCVDGDSCNSWMTPTPGHLPKQQSRSFLRQTNPPHPAGCRALQRSSEEKGTAMLWLLCRGCSSSALLQMLLALAMQCREGQVVDGSSKYTEKQQHLC